MFCNLRRRRGWDRRIARNDDLVPWHVRVEHRWDYDLAMLRVEARRRGGFPLRPDDAKRLDNWLARMASDATVVQYDPEVGFTHVTRCDGEDLIRRPARKTTLRPAASFD